MRASQDTLDHDLLVHSTEDSAEPMGSAAAATGGRKAGQTQKTAGLRTFAGRAKTLLFTLGVIAALTFGWINRDDELITPEHGLGYWLGIAGASLMLMLLLYPLRKRWRAMARIGSVGGWFRVHMMLGVIGPVLILFHSNFKLGSINSNVALISMLIVSSSGIVGRYLYGRIHRGLYGRKVDAQELIDELGQRQVAITGRVMMPAALTARFKAYEKLAHPKAGAGHALASLLRVRLAAFKRRAIRRQLTQVVTDICVAHRFSSRQTRDLVRDFQRAADRYFAAVGRIATFAVYERLFALWHVLHLPLFVLLVLTAIGHIVAVHLY